MVLRIIYDGIFTAATAFSVPQLTNDFNPFSHSHLRYRTRTTDNDLNGMNKVKKKTHTLRSCAFNKSMFDSVRDEIRLKKLREKKIRKNSEPSTVKKKKLEFSVLHPIGRYFSHTCAEAELVKMHVSANSTLWQVRSAGIALSYLPSRSLSSSHRLRVCTRFGWIWIRSIVSVCTLFPHPSPDSFACRCATVDYTCAQSALSAFDSFRVSFWVRLRISSDI